MKWRSHRHTFCADNDIFHTDMPDFPLPTAYRYFRLRFFSSHATDGTNFADVTSRKVSHTILPNILGFQTRLLNMDDCLARRRAASYYYFA